MMKGNPVSFNFICVCLQLGFKNMENIKPTPVSMEKALTVVKDTFISAAERDIHTGDSICICVVTNDGVKEEYFPLRQD